MAFISYVKTSTNKRLPISESHDDLNQCTPCRGKLDQHDTYASHVTSMFARRTLPVGSPHMWQPFAKSSIVIDRTTAPEKKGSRHNP
jgi:hypothetical protein